jgi:hypothetical protein
LTRVGSAMLDRPQSTTWLRRIYPASKSKHWPFWQALRACDLPIVCSWIDAPFNHDNTEITDDAWCRHWDTCLREASNADVVLAYARADETQNGAFPEIGSALGCGAWVYLVSDHARSWRQHPRCKSFASLGRRGQRDYGGVRQMIQKITRASVVFIDAKFETSNDSPSAR